MNGGVIIDQINNKLKPREYTVFLWLFLIIHCPYLHLLNKALDYKGKVSGSAL